MCTLQSALQSDTAKSREGWYAKSREGWYAKSREGWYAKSREGWYAKSREGWYAKGGRPPAYTYLVRDLHLDGVNAGDVDVCGHFFAHLKAQVSQDQLDVTLSQGSDLHDHKAGRRH